MAQLIKLSDYISRYESNIYQYPSQYIRLKKQNWKKIHHLFMQGALEQSYGEAAAEEGPLEKKKLKKLFQRQKEEESGNRQASHQRERAQPQDIHELKQYFLNGLYPFQLKWASTTLRKKSFVDRVYYSDERLMYYLQRFPDTYFVMYEPTVEIKKAKLEANTILIGPLGIEIIHYLDMPMGTIVHPSNNHSWHIEQNGIGSKILNPLLALRRTETYVKSVLQTYDLDFPYKKVVLAPELSFKEVQTPYMTEFIGREQYDTWFQKKRKDGSPLKHLQLKTAESLLKHCHTSAIKRPEWDIEEESTYEEW
ncbi:NERD domain-containing protein [Halobacillus yeomjeoni]|uniref:NERD domain-containing protein n=1 Tax=Halobacillus yeomjeoni TaxID=311194 RepID=UPI001CD5359B|nr:NERD domain-containing protein [Halobacillus yeomjeoni]MCA0982433.1 NERD domain-containing protein [Halobacillus yeomjeoni]